MKLLSIEEIEKSGIHQSAYIETSQINYYDWVRDLCRENKCGSYNKNWACPPALRKGFVSFRKTCDEINEILKEKEIDYMILSAGSCKRCDECSYPDPCRFF